MLKFPRTALGRFRWAAAFCALALTALTATLRPATETALRDGVVERAAERRTTDGCEVWESGGDFNGRACVGTEKIGVLNALGGWGVPGSLGASGVLGAPGSLDASGSLGKSGGRRDVERLRADFDERLRVGAVEFWSTRRSAPGASVALRAVADGWARWSVGPEATARFLATLTTSERLAFERRRRFRAAFDFAADRAASAEASKEAATALTALKSENGENDAEFDGGVDAALTFLRSLDGDESALDGDFDDINKKGGDEPGDEAFLWAASFDGNPLNAVGAFSTADVVAISVPTDSATTRSAFVASATFFFLSTFGVLGGGSPRAWTALLGGVGENRWEREFWRLLDATFRRLGVAAKWLRFLFYFARLALFNAFRRFDVEDGTALKRSLAALCASTRLLN